MTTKDPKDPPDSFDPKELESLLKKQLTDAVQFFKVDAGRKEAPKSQGSSEEGKQSRSEDFLKKIKAFNKTPKELKKYLDQYVIDQNEAKKAISIALCDHYNFVSESLKAKESQGDFHYVKQNVLIMGPTGVGKSYLIKKLAQHIGVPFASADATRFSETGYMGSNVDDVIKDLLTQSDGDFEKASYGIVYFDEIDKLASKPGSGNRDVSGKGVQTGLLKLMEETEIDPRSSHDFVSQMQAFMDFQRKGKVEKNVINTKYILFIVSGAFSGLDEIIRKRINASQIGFNRAPTTNNPEYDDEIFLQAQTDDYIKYGFEPEFIGRLPVRVYCHHLNEDHLYRILKESSDSLIFQYEKAFEGYGISLTIEENALRKIAHLASQQKTGARALLSVFESVFREFKFELPSTGIREFTFTKAMIDDPQGELKKIMDAQPKQPLHNESDKKPSPKPAIPINPEMLAKLQELCNDKADRLMKEFEIDIDIHPSFYHEKLLSEDDMEGAEPTENALRHDMDNLFENLQYGLQLIRDNIKNKKLTLDREFIANPQKTLENWIREEYQQRPTPAN